MDENNVMSAKEMHAQLRVSREGADTNWAIRLHRAISGELRAGAWAQGDVVQPRPAAFTRMAGRSGTTARGSQHG